MELRSRRLGSRERPKPSWGELVGRARPAVDVGPSEQVAKRVRSGRLRTDIRCAIKPSLIAHCWASGDATGRPDENQLPQ